LGAARQERSNRGRPESCRPSAKATDCRFVRDRHRPWHPLERIGRVRLPVGDLEIYWVSVYGGGVFVPFRDATAGTETYGAGHYLLDTVKGADPGGSGDRLVFDFNCAYNPSCAYDPRWSCPLAPPPNRPGWC
jgi:uncharacterized protein (DUF1684 family)